jgi:hypothetical protein
MTTPGPATSGGGTGGGAVGLATDGAAAPPCKAIGWVAVVELALSVGRTSIGVSLFCIGGATAGAG